MDVETLVARAQRGDREALGAALALLAPAMTAYARRMLGHHHDGEDAVGDTLARICRSLHRYEPGRGGFKAWSFTLLRHAIADLASRRRPAGALPEVAHDADPALGPLLAGALAALPEAPREAFLLHHAGFAYAEIAELTGVPVGTVRSRIFTARATLRAALSDTVEDSRAV